MLKYKIQILVFLVYFTGISIGHAHEIRPAYLQIQQVNDSLYEVLWKVPAKQNAIPKISPIFPDALEVKQGEQGVLEDRVYKARWEGVSKDGFRGETIEIEGLRPTLIDVLVDISFLDGERHTLLLQPDKPSAIIPIRPSFWNTSYTYLILGIEHILLGFDHLLFVLALLLLISKRRKLIFTITAFTLAHSITLSLSALGYIGLSSQPVEAVIALSIVFMAVEIARHLRGAEGLTFQYPWLIAFIFGLLHGFGFAGAIQEIGLPQSAIVAALLFFNVGVELGQLMFIAGVLLIFALLKPQNYPKLYTQFKWVMVYGIGGLSMFWLIERVVG